MKIVAILLAVANLAVVAAAAWFMWFIAFFPWENSEPGEGDWLAPAAVVLAVSALGILLGVALDRWGGAAVAFLAQTLIVVALLLVMFDESDDSAAPITASAAVVELVAASAVWLSRSRSVADGRTT